jgi:SAM-dependent methyltransferase
MDDYMRVNYARWNELVAIHEKSEFYDVAGFKAGRNSITDLEREEVGDVTGKSLLHLQCHFGMDTMSWARLGAKVTGVDFSDKAIELAQSLARELEIDARFVRSNIYDLPDDSLIPDRFDIVYTGLGVLGWLPDLKHWARVIGHYLKPGGTFYILEGHPFMLTLDENSPDLKIGYPYFSSEALKFEEEHSYADPNVTLVNKTEYGWNHSLADILNPLIAENLTIEFLHEFPFCGWDCLPDMEKGEDGWRRLKDERKRNMVPLMFSLRAIKK